MSSTTAPLFRLTILLAVIIVISGIWEYRASSPSVVVQGTVVEANMVGSSAQGDNREFIVAYDHGGASHQLVTRRGIADALWKFKSLGAGDSVPVRVNIKQTGRARLDSINARFPFTASFMVLLMIVGVIAVLGRSRQHG